MSAKPPETFGLDRLQTPIGAALLVTDAEGALCALDWEDYEPRMRQLLRLQHGAVGAQRSAGSGRTPDGAVGLFRGRVSHRLDTIKWRVAGTAFQRKVWTALRTIPAGTTMSYGALAARLGMPTGGARGRPRQRRQSHQHRRALSPRDRRQRLADRLWRRAASQAMAARARGRGAEDGVATPVVGRLIFREHNVRSVNRQTDADDAR